MDTPSWRIGTAKQQFSEVVRRSQTEPQKIYNRNQLVAAVVNPEILNELEKSQNEQPGRTLADLFTEFRTICADEGYELRVGERRNREGWPDDVHDEDSHTAGTSRASTG